MPATATAPTKLSILLVQSKDFSDDSDIRKMTAHLEQLLQESDYDVKTRQVPGAITDAVVKAHDVIVFCGYNLVLLAEMFKALSLLETYNHDASTAPLIIYYDEPGQDLLDIVHRIIDNGGRMGRVPYAIADSIVYSSSYREILAYFSSEAGRRSILARASV